MGVAGRSMWHILRVLVNRFRFGRVEYKRDFDSLCFKGDGTMERMQKNRSKLPVMNRIHRSVRRTDGGDAIVSIVAEEVTEWT